MALSIHQASVPVMLRGFGNLYAILDKAAAHAEAAAFDPAVLVNARIAPDMLPLSGQVQRASDTAKSSVARLAGAEIPSFADDEATLPDLQGRIAKTTAFLKSVDAALFEGADERTIEIKVRGALVRFRGASYLLDFALPNFFFHVTTAYDILRHNGVKIGKMDYLGKLD